MRKRTLSVSFYFPYTSVTQRWLRVRLYRLCMIEWEKPGEWGGSILMSHELPQSRGHSVESILHMLQKRLNLYEGRVNPALQSFR